MSLPTRRHAARVGLIAGAIVSLGGVVFAFIQRTDNTPQLTYFTVDSAILFGFTSAKLAFSSVARPFMRYLADCASVATILSGLIWVTVLTPDGFYPPRDDVPVRIANTLLHLALPLLSVLTFAFEARDREPRVRDAFRWLGWPTTYLVIMTVLTCLGLTHFPYLFLQPVTFGWLNVVLAVAGLVAITALLGMLLVGLRRWLAPRVNRPTTNT